jgi:ubiquinone/menaquinone biosynthesis C-methylase UbiE
VYRLDPEEAELRALHALADPRGARVLEVGCGDGRLTRRYAAETAAVLALDVNETAIRHARRCAPASLRERVRFRVADITRVALPAAAFDIAIISWTL